MYGSVMRLALALLWSRFSTADGWWDTTGLLRDGGYFNGLLWVAGYDKEIPCVG